MARGLEHEPGEAASQAGEYHEVNVFGSLTGRRIRARLGDPLPPSPRGFAWRLGDPDRHERDDAQ